MEDIPRRRSKRRKRKVKTIDIGSIADKYFVELSEALGLSVLNLGEKLEREIVRAVLDAIITSSSYKPSLDTLIKRIARHRKKLNKLISAIMLDSIQQLTPEQMEFIISYGEEVVVPYVPELYARARQLGREDLIGFLQYIWEKYGRPTPVQCPRCGFRAITPDLSCYVCGYVVTEDYIRERLEFDTKFREYITAASVAELREIMNIGFVLVSDVEIRSPRSKIDPSIRTYYPIYLRPSEYSQILEEIHSRDLRI